MTPHKAQRTWHSLSSKWINAAPFGGPFGSGRPRRNPRRKFISKRTVKKGILTNLIPVEVVNAITGEVSKGYMRDLSLKKLRQWLEYHNHRAQVEQVSLSPKVTLSHLDNTELIDFPILIKLGRYQVPYLIDYSKLDVIVRNKQTVSFNLRTADNLKYLEIIAERKETIMKLFKKIKKAKKK